ncbi:MAG: NIF family HAD-type phosphatase [Candidatus Sericytochromatia bacterium]
MKNIKKSFLTFLISTSFVFSATLNAFSKDISDFILEPMPEWFSERFTEGQLDIKLMMKNGFTRLEAVEVQNQMKDILESNPEFMAMEEKGETYRLFKNKDTMVLKALKKAIDSVKNNNYFESGFKKETEELKPWEFYIVFDLDETLLVQWYKSGELGEKYYDIKVETDDNILRPTITSPKYISFNPNLEKSLKEIKNIPGCKGVIFFSAKLDDPTIQIGETMKIDGKLAKNFLNGIFTRNYLVREEEPTKLSKDLRIINESLKNVIIVDDNPTRILDKQKSNLREITKYNPEQYLKAKIETKDKKVAGYYEKVLPIIVDEIKEAAQYAEKNKVSFSEAYYPYSMSAQAKLIMLMKEGLSMKDAIDTIRKDKSLFNPPFYFYEKK